MTLSGKFGGSDRYEVFVALPQVSEYLTNCTEIINAMCLHLW